MGDDVKEAIEAMQNVSVTDNFGAEDNANNVDVNSPAAAAVAATTAATTLKTTSDADAADPHHSHGMVDDDDQEGGSAADGLVKIYVGGLPPDLEEDSLKSWLEEKNVPAAESVLVKRGGYAFLEFADQCRADEAITAIDGMEYQGNSLKAEMSVGSERKSSTTTYKVIVSNVHNEAQREDIEPLVTPLGDVQAIDLTNSGTGEDHQTFTLTYHTKEEADKAVKELHETEFKGQTLQARLSERRSPRRMAGSGPSHLQRNIDFPLRILVQSDMVGAIIGRGGQTIRQITQQTRARVDVHRKDSVGSAEKAITIYGQPENCSNACLQILKVMQEEARNTGKSEDIPLKILAHNNLIGRIIGKQGSTIKRIMEETDTKITVSSINEINSFNMERIITIRGEPEQICKAEADVSTKLRQAYESDLNSMPPQSVMFPGLHPAAMVSSVGMGLAFNSPQPPQPQVRLHTGAGGAPMASYYTQYNGMGNKTGNNGGGAQMPSAYGMMSAHDGSTGAHLQNTNMTAVAPMQGPIETTHMYIPNAAVGAIIGAKGSYIRDLNKYSGYSMKIAPANEDTTSFPAAVNPSDRRVTIVGPPDRFWTPQYLVYEKLKIEGFTDAHDGDVILTVEMFAPSSQVGRIIGKGGANVRELQRLTGAMIKLPEQLSPPPKEETSVVIIGKWIQVLTAQQRLRAMIQQTQAPNNMNARFVLGTAPMNGNSQGPLGIHAKVSSGEE